MNGLNIEKAKKKRTEMMIAYLFQRTLYSDVIEVKTNWCLSVVDVVSDDRDQSEGVSERMSFATGKEDK